MRLLRLVLWCATVLCTVPAAAAPLTVSGFLDDCAGNAALVGSDLLAPSCVDDLSVVNNVGIYGFNVAPAEAGTVRFRSVGHAAGGAEPYFSLFQGSGTGASFVASNLAEPLIDFDFAVVLAAGDYMIAIGAWQNMSFAENSGAGGLAEGFIGLGVPNGIGTSYYELDVSFGRLPPPNPIPAPGTLALVALGLLASRHIRRSR